jgi:uncharacterized protein with von Willebrand factor type A (vWA) domain
MDAVADTLYARLAGFPGFLRANGYALGGGDAVQALDVAARVGVVDADRLRWSLQALLCGRVDEWNRFPALFEAWFLPANRWQRPERRDGAGSVPPGGHPGASDADAEADAADDGARPRLAASREEQLASTDFRDLAGREHMLDIEALMRRFARQLARLMLRREERARQGRRIDLPGTIRRSIESGGIPFDLAWRNRRRVRPRLVLLIDVSRSMAAYSFFYLRLARALAAELADVHAFIFHTRLTGITGALRDPDPWRAQERLHVLAHGWGGGTRIGESLGQFAREHAPRLVHARTGILVFSDGYDTGEPERLASTLATLRRRARRIVWLNPLAGLADYSPVSQGMQAALPFLDLHAPAGDLASLRAVLPRVVATLRGR